MIASDEPPAKPYPETTPPLPPSFVAQQRKVPNHLRKPPPPDPSKMSLMELQLVPQSVLLVRFEEDELNRMSIVDRRSTGGCFDSGFADVDVPLHLSLSGSDAKAPLLPELLQQAAPLPPPPDFNRAASASSAPQVGTDGKPKAEGERKVPKSVFFSFQPAEHTPRLK